jgi:alpha-L-fucosidase
LIARYQPAVVWNDISYPKKGEPAAIFSEYLNQVKDGVINDRFGVEFSDFTTPEYAKYDKITPKKWESCRGLGFSFGYNQAEGPEQVLASGELIRLFVDIVSKNGNLLLNIGPKPDGTISEIQLDRLRALGKWLAVNGEGIYGSRPWIRPFSQTADGVDVRFTRKNGSVYAFLLRRPARPDIVIQSVYGSDGMTVKLLGTPGDLKWVQRGKDVAITLPAQYAAQDAYGLEMTPAPSQIVRE